MFICTANEVRLLVPSRKSENVSYTKTSPSTVNLIGQFGSSLFHDGTSNLKSTVGTWSQFHLPTFHSQSSLHHFLLTHWFLRRVQIALKQFSQSRELLLKFRAPRVLTAGLLQEVNLQRVCVCDMLGL